VRVKQIYTSTSVSLFGERMIKKYGLVPYSNVSEPVLIYGMYKNEDYELLKKTKCLVLWCGSDARVINPGRAEILKNHPARHIAKSRDIHKTLKDWGIRSTIIPVTSTMPTISVKPRGKKVYCYIGSDTPAMKMKYKLSLIKGLQSGLPFKFIIVTYRQYPHETVMKLYRQCFIGIRLLDHDGLSNTILEMGLMGRRTISNSGLSCAIPWRRKTDLAKIIFTEYKQRRSDNTAISEATRKYIDIGDKWLEI